MSTSKHIDIRGQLLRGGRWLSLLLVGTAAGTWLGQSAVAGLFPTVITLSIWAGLLCAVVPVLWQKLRAPSLSEERYGELTLFLSSLFCGSALSGAALQPGHIDYFRYFRLAGFLPYTDAKGFFDTIMTWPTETMTVQASRRPLNAVMDIFTFHIGSRTLLGNYFVKAMLSALAGTAFVQALRLHVGRSAAWMAGSVLLYWIWPFLPMQMSETNGIILATVGMALLLFALATRRRMLVFAGIASVAMAEMARSANPLQVYGLAFGLAFLFPFFRNRMFTGILLWGFALVWQLSLPAVLNRWYSHPDAGLNSNIGATLLGLARGTNWAEANDYVFQTYPEQLRSEKRGLERRIDSENEVNRIQLSLVLPTIREQPRKLLFSLQRGFGMVFHQTLERVAEAFGMHRFGHSWERPWIWLPFYGGLAFLSLLLVRSRRSLVFLTVLVLGMYFTFTPLVIGDTGWRIVGTQLAGLSLVTVLLPLGIRHLLCRWRGKNPEEVPMRRSTQSPAAIGMAYAVLALTLSSVPYPGVCRWLAGQESGGGAPVVLKVAVSAERRPGWTGPDSAVITPDMLAEWAVWMRRNEPDNPRWTMQERFFTEQKDGISALRYEGVDQLVLEVKDSAVCAAIPAPAQLIPWMPGVRCRVTR
ncbi:MAG: hypothetical protein RLY31_831 [Bacteroidota bacterium]